MKFIFQGAEATIKSNQKEIVKERTPKLYRYPKLDEKLRIQRTRKEIKLLEKASNIISVPKIISYTDYQIILQKIKGKNLAYELDKLKNKSAVAKKIGETIGKIHNSDIIHGDLTTSNIIYSNSKIYLIDFGLGFESGNIEDKAVDLHVLKEALEARHHKYSIKMFESILKGYKISKDNKFIIKRL